MIYKCKQSNCGLLLTKELFLKYILNLKVLVFERNPTHENLLYFGFSDISAVLVDLILKWLAVPEPLMLIPDPVTQLIAWCIYISWDSTARII